MAYLHWNNIEIAGIAAAVPTMEIDNRNYSDFFTEKEAARVIKTTGIAKRRFVDENTTSADLCYAAADKLLSDMSIDRNTIDALIFTSLTPDYRTPASGIILQNRLGLPKTTLAFDLTLGCSGYMYGLSLAFNLCSQPHINNVLLLNGETKSKTYPKTDKSVALLFGDGGTASLIRKTERSNPTFLSLNSNGDKWEVIQIPGGGYRNPTSPETLKLRKREDGSIRSNEHGMMDGAAVFDFTITAVPKDIRETMEKTCTSPEDIDYAVFHQANKFITDHFSKKLKIPREKVIYSLQKFGNTASVSIPLTIVSELQEELKDTTKRLLMSGFGVGLSWGTMITILDKCHICDLVEI
ncbi:MAG: ketoacyl-ACP synthase III [Candidatus Cloacimonetes bacterium]|nr:ketoacyl-ACP synthase III [Candidatus Cloacimonadota bacterium]